MVLKYAFLTFNKMTKEQKKAVVDKMEVVDLAAALNETEENVDKTIKDLEKNKDKCGERDRGPDPCI